ncbi:MAG: thiol-disulfide isomerase/thioredoxin [Bacillariaceae sp.]|jgi:thiol-disulfide isomerase/thioredoxin
MTRRWNNPPRSNNGAIMWDTIRMIILARTFLLLSVGLCVVMAMEETPDYLYASKTTAVKEYISDDDGTHFLKYKSPRVVEFYSPHCPACIEFSSHYIQLAKETTKMYPDILFFAVSCDSNEKLCEEEYDISEYPSIRLFRYDDGPTSKGIPIENHHKISPKKLAGILKGGKTVVEKEEEDDDEENDDDEDDEDDEEEEEATGTSIPLDSDAGSSGYEKTYNAGYSTERIKYKTMNRYSQTLKGEKENYLQKRHSRLGTNNDNFIRSKDDEKVVYEEMTKGMKRASPGTKEFYDRQQAILQRIKESGGRKHNNIMYAQITQEFKKENLPYSKDISNPKWFKSAAGKIPLVKRIFQMSEEEELILDASLSFIVGLETGLSMGLEDLTSKEALRSWLNLLSVSLPPEWGIHKLIDYLRNNFEYATKNRDTLRRIIKKYPFARKGWSASCQNKKKNTNGFSCGLWKLLHLVTIGVAEQRGGQNLIDSGMMTPETEVFSPSGAADTIRNYIDKFFTCRPCREHFVKMYDDCSNGRCDRLTNHVGSKKPADWKELSLWLWEVHNEVSVRLVRERASKTFTNGVNNIPSIRDEVSAIWPNVDNCILCFGNDGTWINGEVFRLLERTYWPDSEVDPKFDKLLKVDGEGSPIAGLLWIMTFLIVWLVYKVTGKQSNSIQMSLIAARQLISQGAGVSMGVTNKSRTV